MPTYSSMSRFQLKKRLQELQQQLEAAAPSLVSEMKEVENQMALREAAEVPKTQTFADCVGPQAAVERCLDLYGDFTMSKKQIISCVLNGGYLAAKPKSAHGLINDSLNNQIRKGRYTLKRELVGRVKASPSKNTRT